MLCRAVPASLVFVASCLVGAARAVASLFGRGKPSDAAGLTDDMLRDIGLSRHDVWADGGSPQFRTMADVARRPGRSDAAGRR